MLTFNHVSKKFADNYVLRDVSLSIDVGSICALVGSNGAGKTTLMKIACGLLTSDCGNVVADGKVSALFGGDSFLPKFLTGFEYVNLLANLGGLKNDEVGEMLKRSDGFLETALLEMEIRKMSRGQRQKVALAGAMLGDAEIYLFDEPSTGLDIESASAVIDSIIHLKRLGKTVLIASHNIHEISELSDSVAILSKGTIAVHEDTKSFFSGVAGSAKAEYLTGKMRGM